MNRTIYNKRSMKIFSQKFSTLSIILFLLYVITRLWVFYTLPHFLYVPLYDGFVYYDVSKLSLLNYHFYFTRPFIYPLFVKLLNRNIQLIFIVQMIISIMAWFYLSQCVRVIIKNTKLQLIASLFVLIYSCGGFIVVWDVKLLTESLSISLFVLFAGTFLLSLNTKFKSIYLWKLIVSGFIFANIRDSNAFLLLAIGLMTAFFAYLLRSNNYPIITLKKAKIFLFSTIIAFSFSYITGLHRWIEPMCEVLSYRLLNYPGASKYLLDHGYPAMPANILGLDKNAVIPASCIYLESNSPNEWQWFKKHARTVYLIYLLTHPDYSLNRYGFGDRDFWRSLISDQNDLFKAIFAFELPEALAKNIASPNPISYVLYPLSMNKFIVAVNKLDSFVTPTFFIIFIVLYFLRFKLNRYDPVLLSVIFLVFITISLSLLIWNADGAAGYRQQLMNNIQLAFAFLILTIKSTDNLIVTFGREKSLY